MSSWTHADVPYDGLYCAPVAPHIVFATGSAGPHLQKGYGPAVRTYMSSDFGASWRQVCDSVCSYEVAANGGILVLAPTFLTANPSDPASPVLPITQLQYSINDGSNWIPFPLAPLPGANASFFFYRINALQAAAGNAGTYLFAYGRDTAMVSQAYGISFAGALGACGAADYETRHSGSCHDGNDIGYTIRRNSSACLPATRALRAPSLAGCGCGPASLTCGYGYWRDWRVPGSACRPLASFAEDPGCPARDSSPTRTPPDNRCPAGGRPHRRGRGSAVAPAVAVPLAVLAAGVLFIAHRRGLLRCGRRPSPPAFDHNDERYLMSGSPARAAQFAMAPQESPSWTLPPPANGPTWVLPRTAEGGGGYAPPAVVA